MTDTFREIERGHEAKFKLDEELRFKINSRCCKMFGLWAADHLGLNGPQADEYARHLVRRMLDRAKPETICDEVISEFAAAGVGLSEMQSRTAFARCYALACEQIGADYPTPLGSDHIQVGG
ncbi:MAG: DUF1476 domain-containing protein [Rhodospirillales bacterium]|nr:DUF1476 domain-containing protein [Rhodospirillales bacterium]